MLSPGTGVVEQVHNIPALVRLFAKCGSQDERTINLQRRFDIAGRPNARIRQHLAHIGIRIEKHPFVDRESPLYAADFVTLETGTGLVHIAPGHGADDYKLGQEHGLETFAPVDKDAAHT